MQLGLQIASFHPGPAGGNEWDSTLHQAQVADRLGFHSVWLYDHFMWVRGEPSDPEYAPVIECYLGLGGIAVQTHRVKIGALVAGAPYRNPALHAKMVATLDLMSHGRAIFGIGAAWAKHEFDAYGWPFEDVGTRMKRLEESIQIAFKMWTERPATFHGQYHSIENALCDPPGVQKPHVPIFIGGDGEKVTLRLVAQYGNYCNVFGQPADVQRKFEVLQQHCQSIGRRFDDITRSNMVYMLVGRTEKQVAEKRRRYGDRVPERSAVVGTPEQVIEKLRGYAEAGSQLVTIQMLDSFEIEPIELLGKNVIPALADV